MRCFFDTSALIPVFLDGHMHHEASLAALLSVSKQEAYCAAHSLAEAYATLTRMPGTPRLSGEQVLLFLEDIRDRLTPVALDSREYYSAIKHATALGIVGGTIYDALLAQCALKARAEVIYTWNIADFLRLGPEVARRVRTP